MAKNIYTIFDIPIAIFWLIAFLIIGFIITKVKYKNSPLAKQFMIGLILKFIGCLGFVVIYTFYYKYGDTFRYFENASTLHSILFHDPLLFFQLLLKDQAHENYSQFGLADMFWAPANFVVVKFCAVFGLFTFNSYLANSLFFAFFSYIGIWMLYRTVAYIIPRSYHLSAIPILYFPSVFFWGSSIMKDSLVIMFIGIATYSFYFLFFKKRKWLLHLILLLFSLYTLKTVKTYVVIAFIPALLIWLFLGSISSLNKFFQFILKPILSVLVIASFILLAPMIGKISERYAIDQVLATAESTANYIHRVSEAKNASTYTIDVEYTPIGILKAFPAGVIVTLYRPFLFEAKNPVMLLSALEGTVVLFFTLFVIVRVGPLKLFSRISSQPFLLASLSFSIFFAFAIGISTFNFGSLVRYKIPCIPFYGIALLVPYLQIMQEKKAKKLARKEK